MKFTRNKIIIGILILILLGLSFWYGGDAPGLEGLKPNKSSDNTLVKLEVKDKDIEEDIKDEELVENAVDQVEESEELNVKYIEEENKGMEEAEEKIKKESETYSKEQGMEIDTEKGTDKYATEAVPQGKPIPIEAENSEIINVEKYCTLSVECSSILDNMEWLNPDKVELVPKDGVIYTRKKVVFYQGESVFNVLLREMKKSKIHMEFKSTPIYNSSYVKGINNLYEFDCGELSGWMYKVNDWFPNYGSSRYVIKEGDIIEWHYTCDLGKDIGASSAMGGE